LFVKLPENEVSPLFASPKFRQFKCMRKRQAGYFLSRLRTLAKFPA
jgi:hypothetical protein